MKTIPFIGAVILLFSAVAGLADSKRTADFLRLNPQAHVGKEVTVDVSMVKPVHWKSPVKELAFFHALTIDRSDNRSGGWILVAVAAEDAMKFAKKYGTNFDGRGDKDRLTGNFVLVSGRGPSGLWLIDTTDSVAQLIKDKRLVLPDGARNPGDPGRGGPGNPRQNDL